MATSRGLSVNARPRQTASVRVVAGYAASRLAKAPERTLQLRKRAACLRWATRALDAARLCRTLCQNIADVVPAIGKRLQGIREVIDLLGGRRAVLESSHRPSAA